MLTNLNACMDMCCSLAQQCSTTADQFSSKVQAQLCELTGNPLPWESIQRPVPFPANIRPKKNHYFVQMCFQAKRLTPKQTCPAALEIIWLFISVHQLEQLQCKSWAYGLYWILTDWSSMRTYLEEYCSLQYPTCSTIQPLATYIICYKQYCILSL